MRHLRAQFGLSLLLVAALCTASGCGGGGAGSAGAVGSLSLSVRWPARSDVSPAAMPEATESLRVTVTQLDAIVAEATAARTPGGGNTTIDLTDVPMGDATLDVYGYGYDPNTIIAHTQQPVTIVAGGDNQVSVDLTPTPNTAPTAAFTLSPSPVEAGNAVTVDASGCTDAETATTGLQVRWDWENDGTWDTDWSLTKTAQTSYAAHGTYTIVLQVRDPSLLAAATTHVAYVVISPPPG